MARYIEGKALLNALKEERKKGNFVFTVKWIKEIIDDLPTADVAPKSEVERKALLKAASKFSGHSDYHGDTILCQLICMAEGKETKQATPIPYRSMTDIKSEVAREIVGIIDQRMKVNLERLNKPQSNIWKIGYQATNEAYQDIKEIIEQKYTEEKE